MVGFYFQSLVCGKNYPLVSTHDRPTVGELGLVPMTTSVITNLVTISWWVAITVSMRMDLQQQYVACCDFSTSRKS